MSKITWVYNDNSTLYWPVPVLQPCQEVSHMQWYSDLICAEDYDEPQITPHATSWIFSFQI